MAEYSKELKIRVSGSADPSTDAVRNQLLKSYRDVKNQIQPIPLQLTTEFRADSILKEAENVRSQLQRAADRQVITFVAQLDSRQVRHIAMGLGSGTPRDFIGPRNRNEQEVGSPQSFREFQRQAPTFLAGAFRENLAAMGRPEASQVAALEKQREDLLTGQNLVEAQTLAKIKAGLASTEELATDQADHARQVKLLDDAIQVALQQQAQGIRDQAFRGAQADDAAEQHRVGLNADRLKSSVRGPNDRAMREQQEQEARDAVYRNYRQTADRSQRPGHEGLTQDDRDARNQLIRSQRNAGIAYNALERQIEAEVAARIDLNGETAEEAMRVVQAEARLAHATNQLTAQRRRTAIETPQGEEGVSGTLAGLRQMFGRYSPLAQIFQITRAAGPLLALGLAEREIGQVTTAYRKMNDEIRSGAKGAAEARTEFDKSLPIVGGILTTILDIKEAISGEESEQKRINALLDHRKKTAEEARKSELDWLTALREVKEQTAEIGLEGPAIDRRRAISDRENSQTANQNKRDEEIRKESENLDRQHALQAARTREAEARARILPDIKEGQFKSLPFGMVGEAVANQYGRSTAQTFTKQEAADRAASNKQATADATAAFHDAESLEQEGVDAKNRIRRNYRNQDTAEEEKYHRTILQLLINARRENIETEGEYRRQLLDLAASTEAQSLRAEAQHARDRGLTVTSIELQRQAEHLESQNKFRAETVKVAQATVDEITKTWKSLDFGVKVPVIKWGAPLVGGKQGQDGAFLPGGILQMPMLGEKIVPPDIKYDKEQFRHIGETAKSAWEQFKQLFRSRAQEEQTERDRAKRASDLARLDEEQEESKHQRHVRDIQATSAADRLKQMGLDFDALRVQRNHEYQDRIEEIQEQAAKERILRPGKRDIIDRREKEDIEAEKEKYRSERGLDIQAELRNARQAATLPQANESRFLTVSPFAKARVESDLIVGRLHTLQETLHADLVAIDRSIRGVPGFADGGIVGGNRLIRVGENGPELITPIADIARGAAREQRLRNAHLLTDSADARARIAKHDEAQRERFRRKGWIGADDDAEQARRAAIQEQARGRQEWEAGRESRREGATQQAAEAAANRTGREKAIASATAAGKTARRAAIEQKSRDADLFRAERNRDQVNPATTGRIFEHYDATHGLYADQREAELAKARKAVASGYGTIGPPQKIFDFSPEAYGYKPPAPLEDHTARRRAIDDGIRRATTIAAPHGPFQFEAAGGIAQAENARRQSERLDRPVSGADSAYAARIRREHGYADPTLPTENQMRYGTATAAVLKQSGGQHAEGFQAAIDKAFDKQTEKLLAAMKDIGKLIPDLVLEPAGFGN